MWGFTAPVSQNGSILLRDSFPCGILASISTRWNRPPPLIRFLFSMCIPASAGRAVLRMRRFMPLSIGWMRGLESRVNSSSYLCIKALLMRSWRGSSTICLMGSIFMMKTISCCTAMARRHRQPRPVRGSRSRRGNPVWSEKARARRIPIFRPPPPTTSGSM